MCTCQGACLNEAQLYLSGWRVRSQPRAVWGPQDQTSSSTWGQSSEPGPSGGLPLLHPETRSMHVTRASRHFTSTTFIRQTLQPPRQLAQDCQQHRGRTEPQADLAAIRKMIKLPGERLSGLKMTESEELMLLPERWGPHTKMPLDTSALAGRCLECQSSCSVKSSPLGSAPPRG